MDGVCVCVCVGGGGGGGINLANGYIMPYIFRTIYSYGTKFGTDDHWSLCKEN